MTIFSTHPFPQAYSSAIVCHALCLNMYIFMHFVLHSACGMAFLGYSHRKPFSRKHQHSEPSIITREALKLQDYDFVNVEEKAMKIELDKAIVEITPENAKEAEQLDTLWKVIIDCAGTNKKLVPIGEYIPVKSTLARFTIED